MRRILALIVGLIPASLAAEPPADVRLDSVSYSELASELKGLKGKVVLVDVWGTFCAPCKEKFPKVVALHEKYRRQGLTVISVSVDPPDDADAREAVRAFLAARRATFHNVLLTDKAEVWQDKWKVIGPPLLFLFDREGRLVARWDDKVDMAEVEKRVAAVLAE
ncbi:MAG TPA: TlpA disulfide reductase family protein [Gemmataceae bacterium]|nr:TlpA disulfide reductase family protein [Gemmataceae bacterium]